MSENPLVGNRRPITRFAAEMEKRLTENDNKTHWSKSSYPHLIEGVRDNFTQLQNALLSGAIDSEEALEDCTDIANYAMMIHDNILRGRERTIPKEGD